MIETSFKVTRAMQSSIADLRNSLAQDWDGPIDCYVIVVGLAFRSMSVSFTVSQAFACSDTSINRH